jgi:hypothetical protein
MNVPDAGVSNAKIMEVMFLAMFARVFVLPGDRRCMSECWGMRGIARKNNISNILRGRLDGLP